MPSQNPIKHPLEHVTWCSLDEVSPTHKMSIINIFMFEIHYIEIVFVIITIFGQMDMK
jgi:hypothetical protein